MRRLVLLGVIVLAHSIASPPELSPGEIQKLVAAAGLAEKNGRTDEALKTYLDVLRLAPALGPVLTKVGGLYYNRREYDSAYRYLSRAQAANPGDFYAVKFAGMAAFRLGMYERAVALLTRAAAIEKRDAEIHRWLGMTHQAAGRPRKAIEELYAALDRDPKDIESLYLLGKIHWELSQKAWGEMNRVAPGSYRVHALLGEANLQAKRTQEAIQEYLTVVRLAPEVPGFHEILGRLYQQENDLDQAQHFFQQELKLAPESSPFSYLGLAQILSQRQDPKAALEYVRQAIRQKPDLGDAHLLEGKLHQALNENPKAVEALERAARLLPADPSPHYLLMRIYDELGDTVAANRAQANFERLHRQPKPIAPETDSGK